METPKPPPRGAETPPLRQDWHRVLSAFVALLMLGLAVLTGEPRIIIGILSVLVWPFAMIWWSDVLGSVTGIQLGLVNQASAGWLVRGFGWVLLLLVAVWYLPFVLGWYCMTDRDLRRPVLAW